jgi:hypothetical protein
MNSTLMRFGKKGWLSISRPISCQMIRAGNWSQKTAQ